MARTGSALAVLLTAALAVACVAQPGLPDDCGAGAVQRQATLSGERLDPESIDVCRGQSLTLRIASQRAGELHLHGYDEEVPEAEVEPGETATLTFTASRAGQFIIELHPPSGAPEIEVGLLTVHEP